MIAPRNTASFLSLLLFVATAAAQNTANFDQFTYGSTDTSDPDNRIYGPSDWGRVRCPNLDICMGWPEDWVEGKEWELGQNHCRDCSRNCGRHHQSPINLERRVALEGNSKANTCIDVHWMAYHDSSCSFEELQDNNAFSIERYALKIGQPVLARGNDKYVNGCYNNGRRWGKIDFSKGFSHWWHLSHMDFHVPSEHTQEGRRYDGEIHMYHWYSVTGEEAGINNEMASVTFFLEAYDDTPDFDMLNRAICEWRAVEEETREQCGRDSVETEYPGCFFYRRGHEGVVQTQSAEGVRKRRKRRNLRQSNTTDTRDEITMAHHIFEHNWKYGSADNTTFKPKTIIMSDEDFEEPEVDWEAFIAQQYENERARAGHRHLVNYEHVGPYHNYWPLIGVKTEYYYRYSGTQTIPPCYGRRIDQARRRQTNNWRVMKDPIRISKRQLAEMHRLLKERIAPSNDPIRRCRPDTATVRDPNDPDKVWGARPLQTWEDAHHKTFCECENWGSKWEEDREWCRMRDKRERFYEHPYNFETDGF